MTIKIYFDEDSMDQRLIRALRARGLNITTAKEESMINRSDREHLEYATNSNRVVFSFNRKDFYNIHIEYTEQGKNHAGIIQSEIKCEGYLNSPDLKQQKR